MERAADIETALRGTALRGHPVEEGLGGTFLVGGVDADDVPGAWRAAHSVLPVTGRWPMFTGLGDLCNEPDAAELADLDRAAREVDPWTICRRYTRHRPEQRDDVERYVSAFLGDEYVPAALDALDPPTPRITLERWTYDTLLADPDLAARAVRGTEHLVGTARWFRPAEVQLVLLPTASPWLAPAWSTYHGAEVPQGWAGAMRQWHDRWGAGLVASWGTMLQFLAERRPALGDEAWELAGQHLALGGSLQCEQWQLAYALTRDDAWFLHDRP